MDYPRIILIRRSEDRSYESCGFAAEGLAGGARFRLGASFDAAATVPERHETIREALLAKAASLMAEAEKEPIRWEGRGFQWDGDFWRYDYSIDDIWDVLES